MDKLSNKKAKKVRIRIVLSGWLCSYFNNEVLSISIKNDLREAYSEIISKLLSQAKAPLPVGGMMVLVNGKSVKNLINERYLLKEEDEVTLVPVVAGG